MKTKIIVGAMMAVLMTTGALAGRADLWVHVKVDDGDENVRVNIPLSLVRNILPLVNVDPLRNGRLRIDEFDLDDYDDVDLRELYKQIRKLDDAEFLTVQNDQDETIRVFKEGAYIMVTFQDRGDEEGFVRIPLDVLGALFRGEEGELDLLAALDELGRQVNGDLVQIRDGRTQVRVWIDDRNTSE